MSADPALQRLRCNGEIIGHQDKVRQELEELIQVLKRGKSAPRAPGSLCARSWKKEQYEDKELHA